MSNPNSLVRLTIDSEIARLTFNRPERLNAFDVAMHQALAQSIDAVAASGARALIVTGEGRAFSVGQDLHDEAITPGAGHDVAVSLELYYNPLIERVLALPMPVVCAVNGVAAGAAIAIALACDVVIAARSATFSFPFAGIGLAPDSGVGWLLPRAVGLPRALGLAFMGQSIAAEQAFQWGLIWAAVDDADLQDAALRLASTTASKSLPALVAARRLFRESGARALSVHLAEEREVQSRLCALPDYAEAIAAFRARRAPLFVSRAERT